MKKHITLTIALSLFFAITSFAQFPEFRNDGKYHAFANCKLKGNSTYKSKDLVNSTNSMDEMTLSDLPYGEDRDMLTFKLKRKIDNQYNYIIEVSSYKTSCSGSFKSGYFRPSTNGSEDANMEITKVEQSGMYYKISGKISFRAGDYELWAVFENLQVKK